MMRSDQARAFLVFFGILVVDDVLLERREQVVDDFGPG